MHGHGTALEALATAAHRVGAAQLLARRCSTLGAAAVDESLVVRAARESRLWRSGQNHAEAVLRVAGDERLETDLAGVDANTASSVSQLALPTELLLLLGADERVQPLDGQNGYGFPVHDVDPAARLSSCTSTPPDALSIAAAEEWRSRTLARALGDRPPSRHELRGEVTDAIAAAMHLPPGYAERIILSPSGTDAETVVVALLLYGRGRPVVNILIGARETGSGTRPAAGGLWFCSHPPLGEPVTRGQPVAGLGPDLVRVVDVEIRDVAGRVRRAFDVEAEVEAHVEDAIASGAMVVVHALEASKTGLRQLSPAWVRQWRRRYPDKLRAVVDAAQWRITTSTLREYLAAGASVVITGSKALSGPSFCGALVLDDATYGDASRCEALPAGLAQLLSQTDVPDVLAGLTAGWSSANVGLLARWHSALAERARLSVLSHHEVAHRTTQILQGMAERLARVAAVDVLPRRDAHPSILSFAVRGRDGEFLGRRALEQVHRAAVGDGVYLGQPVEIVHEGMAVLRAAVGAATLTRLPAGAAGDVAVETAAEAAVGAVASALPAAAAAL